MSPPPPTETVQSPPRGWAGVRAAWWPSGEGEDEDGRAADEEGASSPVAQEAFAVPSGSAALPPVVLEVEHSESPPLPPPSAAPTLDSNGSGQWEAGSGWATSAEPPASDRAISFGPEASSASWAVGSAPAQDQGSAADGGSFWADTQVVSPPAFAEGDAWPSNSSDANVGSSAGWPPASPTEAFGPVRTDEGVGSFWESAGDGFSSQGVAEAWGGSASSTAFGGQAAASPPSSAPSGGWGSFGSDAPSSAAAPGGDFGGPAAPAGSPVGEAFGWGSSEAWGSSTPSAPVGDASAAWGGQDQSGDAFSASAPFAISRAPTAGPTGSWHQDFNNNSPTQAVGPTSSWQSQDFTGASPTAAVGPTDSWPQQGNFTSSSGADLSAPQNLFRISSAPTGWSHAEGS